MFVLLMIVIFAVSALWLSNKERKHPAALILLGLMSVVLGGRAVALLSDSYSDEFLGAVVADEKSPPTELPAKENAL